MRIKKIIPDLYASNQINDWTEVTALAPDLIIGVGANTKDTPIEYHKAIYVEWHIEDEHVLPDKKLLRRIAKFAVKFLDKGQRVLVHDKSGNNRVYLMVAEILYHLGEDGPYDVITHADSRTSVLSNAVFKEYVRDL